MPIEVSWHPDLPNVIWYRFSRNWNWDEFRRAFERSLELAAERPDQIYDVMSDLSNAPTPPPGFGLSHVYSVLRRAPANHGLTVVITNNRFIQTMVGVARRVYPDLRYRFDSASTIEEAWQLITQKRLAMAS